MTSPLSHRLARTNSICPSPHEILLELVKKNDCEAIRTVIEDNPTFLTYVYDQEYNKPILLIALTEDNIRPETIQTLIDLGADLYYSSEIDEQWEALHFAAFNTNSFNLKAVVNNLKPGKINALAKGNNALHVLVKHGKSESQKEFVRCAEVLIREGIDLNQGDEKNLPPIFWAAKKGYKDIVKVILENGTTNVDIDSHNLRGKTARDLILDKNLYNLTSENNFGNNNYEKEPSKILFNYLKADNENGFVNYRNGDIFEYVDSDDTSNTLLQLSCQKGLKKAVQHLLSKGADPNKVIEKNNKTPIKIVAELGYHKIFESFIDHPYVKISDDIVIDLMKNLDNDKFPEINHEKCYELLMSKQKLNSSLVDVNHTDNSRNSPLHYAVRYGNSKQINDLLGLGASLACKNKYNFMPVQDIEPYDLETHLDNCVEFDTKSKNIDKEDFTVTFNYRTLIPPVPKVDKNKTDSSDAETGFQNATQDLVAETEVISYISKSPELKYLLKHPVIVSFLFMKWQRICWLFYTNLAFYIAFFASLIVYIFTSYVNFDEDRSGFLNFVITLSWIILCLCFILLTLRELFQICVSPCNYFKNFENYIEIILIAITGCIIMINSPTSDTRKQLSSLAILLAAFELVLMVGQHPKLSTNVVMLKTVSFNFFKFLLWYSLLIVAFALSFYIIFTEPEEETTSISNGNSTEEGEENFFTNPGKSVFKTIVMLTGEFDAGSINFQTFPITSKLIFTLFVFMIAIILLNLLNGLAVSDTQTIRNDSELVGHISRTEHIRYVESMLLGNILPSNLIRIIQNLCCCLPFNTDLTLAIGRPCARRVCLFPHYLNYELTFYPNRQGQVHLPSSGNRRSPKQNCLGGCTNIYLDKDTIKRTHAIVQLRRDSNKHTGLEKEVENLESMVGSLNQKIQADKIERIYLRKELEMTRNLLTKFLEQNQK